MTTDFERFKRAAMHALSKQSALYVGHQEGMTYTEGLADAINIIHAMEEPKECMHDYRQSGNGVRECRKCGAEDFGPKGEPRNPHTGVWVNRAAPPGSDFEQRLAAVEQTQRDLVLGCAMSVTIPRIEANARLDALARKIAEGK